MNKEIILGKINSSFEEVVKKYGFKLEHNAYGAPFFLNRTTETTLRVAPSIGRIWVAENYFEASGAHADMRVKRVENLWEESAPILNISTDKTMGFHTYHVSTLDVYPELEKASNASRNKGWLKYDISESGIREYIEKTDFLLDKKVLPKIKHLNDPMILDKSINHKVALEDDLSTYFLNSKGLIFRRIILAKQAKNTLYEDICEYHRSFFEEYKELARQKQFEYFKNYPIVFERLYDDLKRIYPYKDTNS